MFEQKRFAGRHLLTFESQKLNYFGKKGGAGVLTLQWGRSKTRKWENTEVSPKWILERSYLEKYST